MTNEEAIKTLTLIKMDSFNFDDGTIGIKEGEQALYMAIEALQKQVPMKPTEVNGLPWEYKCPVCGRYLKRIDWSDEE